MLRKFLELFGESLDPENLYDPYTREEYSKGEGQLDPEAGDVKSHQFELSDEEVETIASTTLACIPQEVRQLWAGSALSLDQNAHPSQGFSSASELHRNIQMYALDNIAFLVSETESDIESFWDIAAMAEQIGAPHCLQIGGIRDETISRFEHASEVDPAFDALLARFEQATTEYNEITHPEANVRLLMDSVVEKIRNLRKRDELMLEMAIDEHKEILVPAVLRETAINTNKYGRTDFGPVYEEVAEFIRSAHFEEDILTFTYEGAIEWTLDFVLQNFRLSNEDDNFPQDGHEFEAWCSERLASDGIPNELTSNGADQGVDIVANINGREVAIQCKRYNKPVGNRAVQEILAGARFYGIEDTCVISTSGFTRSAKELAEKGGVTLISVEDLGKLKSHF